MPSLERLRPGLMPFYLAHLEGCTLSVVEKFEGYIVGRCAECCERKKRIGGPIFDKSEKIAQTPPGTPKGPKGIPKGAKWTPKINPRAPKASQRDKLYINKLPINRLRGRYVIHYTHNTQYYTRIIHHIIILCTHIVCCMMN